MSKKGFTLIELLVVVAVLALLASIVTSNLGGAREGARISNALQFQSNIHSLLGSDLVGWWNFNDPTSRYKDTSGYDNHGSCTSCPTATDGVPGTGGSALSFDGSNDYITLTSNYWRDIFNNDPGNDFTIFAWIYPRSIKNSSIVGQRLCDSMVFGVKENGKLFLGMDDIGCLAWGSLIESVETLETDKWQHVAVSFVNDTSSSMAYFYINGNPNGSAPAWDGSGIEIQNFMFIGWQSRGHAGIGSMHFDGLIDDVRIYNRAMSAREVGLLYVDTKDDYLSEK